jgi:hypothetical protein
MKPARCVSSAPPACTAFGIGPSAEVDEELVWFFCAEDGDFAPQSNFGRMLSPVSEDGTWRTPEDHFAAVRRHRALRGCLRSMPDRDAGVLQCAYLPRPWPVRLRKELGRLTGIVVRLACDRATWPEERGQQLALDAENAERLDGMLRRGDERDRATIRALRRAAIERFGDALREYRDARHGRDLGRQP